MKNKFYFFTMLSMAVLAVISGGAGFMLAAGTAALANGESKLRMVYQLMTIKA